MDWSTPELASVGSTLLVVSAILGVLAGLSLIAQRRKAAIVLGALALATALTGLAAVTDILCVAGYVADDGSCAWE